MFTPASAQQWRQGKVAEVFAQHCASCHGAELQGGSAPSLLDDVWSHGSDDESLLRSILEGYPENGMPGWRTLFSEKEARSLVFYIREVRARNQYQQQPLPLPDAHRVVKSKHHAFRLTTWIEGLKEPWSLAFLPGAGSHAIVTEKGGAAYLISDGQRSETALAGTPDKLETGGQGGLFDVVPHPRYVDNGWLYLAYADLRAEGSLTRVIRARLQGGTLVAREDIFSAPGTYYINGGRAHYGGRIAFDRDGYLYFTLGERNRRDLAQRLDHPGGKVHRLRDDGSIPDDNPFVQQSGAIGSIWTYGHRNPQGLAFQPGTGRLYAVEHGPRGGDELNLLQRGRNYGWPVITYGMEYSGEPIAETTHREGMEQPVAHWTPSLGVCGLSLYQGDLFPRWRDHAFFASLSGQELRRVEVNEGRLVEQEILFKGLGRIRHVVGGPDGALYVLLPDRIARLTPAAE